MVAERARNRSDVALSQLSREQHNHGDSQVDRCQAHSLAAVLILLPIARALSRLERAPE